MSTKKDQNSEKEKAVEVEEKTSKNKVVEKPIMREYQPKIIPFPT